MGIKYNEIELTALTHKEENPNETVFCPRCGCELSFKEIDGSYEIKCLTANCLKRTVRGL